MEVKLQVIFFICVLLAVISAKNVKSKPGTLDDYGEFVDENTEVQNDDYYDGPDESGHNTTPDENNDTIKAAEFRTKPMAFIGHIGETILLPCESSDPEVVLAWYKDDNKTFLFQAEAAITHYPNMHMYPNGTLAINLTSETDFGKFSCKMLLQKSQPEIIHVINTPAKIISITTADNSKVYSVGQTLNLTCLATGYPKPKITWHKGSETIGVEGETLTIPDLKFKNAGIYRCLADNNILSPDHSHIEINIEHKPVVSIEKYMVNSDREHDTELKCTVRAYPKPYVAWKKNGINIIQKEPKVVLKTSDNVENILIIRNLTDEDFAEYTCSAKNRLGSVEKSVKLVKTPVVQGFVKPEKANREVELTWKIDSKSPISKHQLQYRKKNEAAWHELDPEVSHENGVYTLKYTLKDLDAGSYETRVRSQNVHGWSDYSQIMPFEGVLAKNGLHHKPHNKKHQKEKDMREKQTTTTETPPLHRNIDDDDDKSVSESVKASVAGCAAVASSVSLICIALLTTFFNRQ